MHKFRFNRAFTLMEIMVVVIIISIIAGFGMPNYYKNYERGHVKNAESQLRMIERAQRMYFTQNDVFFPENGSGNESDVADINDELNVYLILGAFSYECVDTTDDSSYQCIAVRNGNTFYTVKLDGYWDGSGELVVSLQCVDGTKTCP